MKYECPYLGCGFATTDEFYLTMHHQLDHSIFHSEPMRELLTQLFQKLLASKTGMLEFKIPRSRILAAEPQKLNDGPVVSGTRVAGVEDPSN